MDFKIKVDENIKKTIRFNISKTTKRDYVVNDSVFLTLDDSFSLFLTKNVNRIFPKGVLEKLGIKTLEERALLVKYVEDEFKLWWLALKTGLTLEELEIYKNRKEIVKQVAAMDKGSKTQIVSKIKSVCGWDDGVSRETVENRVVSVFNATKYKGLDLFKERKVVLTDRDNAIIENWQLIKEVLIKKNYVIYLSVEGIKELGIEELESLSDGIFRKGCERIYKITKDESFNLNAKRKTGKNSSELLRKNVEEIVDFVKKQKPDIGEMNKYLKKIGSVIILDNDSFMEFPSKLNVISGEKFTINDFNAVKKVVSYSEKEKSLMENEGEVLSICAKYSFVFSSVYLLDEINYLVNKNGGIPYGAKVIKSFFSKRFLETKKDIYDVSIQSQLYKEDEGVRRNGSSKRKMIESYDLIREEIVKQNYSINKVNSKYGELIHKNPEKESERFSKLFMEIAIAKKDFEMINYEKNREQFMLSNYEDILDFMENNSESGVNALLTREVMIYIEAKYGKSQDEMVDFVESGMYSKAMKLLGTNYKSKSMVREELLRNLNKMVVRVGGKTMVAKLKELSKIKSNEDGVSDLEAQGELLVNVFEDIFNERIQIKDIEVNEEATHNEEKLLTSILQADITDKKMNEIIDEIITFIKYSKENKEMELTDSHKMEIRAILFTYFKTDYFKDVEYYGDDLITEEDGKTKVSPKIYKLINKRTLNFKKESKELTTPFSFKESKGETTVYFDIGFKADLDTCYHSPYRDKLFTASATGDIFNKNHEYVWRVYNLKSAWYQHQLNKNNIHSSIERNKETGKVTEKNAQTILKGHLEGAFEFRDPNLLLVRADGFYEKITLLIEEMEPNERAEFNKVLEDVDVGFFYGGMKKMEDFFMIRTLGQMFKEYKEEKKVNFVNDYIQNQEAESFNEVVLRNMGKRSILYANYSLADNELIFNSATDKIVGTVNVLHGLIEKKFTSESLREFTHNIITIASLMTRRNGSIVDTIRETKREFFEYFLEKPSRALGKKTESPMYEEMEMMVDTIAEGYKEDKNSKNKNSEIVNVEKTTNEVVNYLKGKLKENGYEEVQEAKKPVVIKDGDNKKSAKNGLTTKLIS